MFSFSRSPNILAHSNPLAAYNGCRATRIATYLLIVKIIRRCKIEPSETRLGILQQKTDDRRLSSVIASQAHSIHSKDILLSSPVSDAFN